MSGPRIGALFAGYGGLEEGVRQVLGGTVAWHSEIDPAASRIIAHHWPGVPNLGDITAVDWCTVEPVDVLTGGFPCQDVSHAGKRLGMKPGTRSGLWSHMAYAVTQLRPAFVVAENVRGLLSAEAGGDLEPCPWCVGDGGGSPLRALGGVLGDLADIGYDARWCGLRAADVGAPHLRFRVFVLAWPATDALSGRRDGWAHDPWRRPVERAIAGRGRGPVAADPDGPACGERRLAAPGQAEGRGARADAGGRGGAPAADSDGTRLEGRRAVGGGSGRLPRTCGVVDWGAFGPAIRRWERVLGRPAPPPTEPGRSGQPRLSPVFVEWLMGLPAGHVTAVPGVSRNEQLKALGNGVVPQQAAEALRRLLGVEAEVAA